MTTKHYPRVQRTSVRARLLDLLESEDGGGWFTIRDLEGEYSARFGPVKLATLRRAILRELAAEDCEVLVRRRSDLLRGHEILEVRWQVPIEEAS